MLHLPTALLSIKVCSSSNKFGVGELWKEYKPKPMIMASAQFNYEAAMKLFWLT